VPFHTVRTGDPARRWSEVDRALHLAWTLYLDGLCSGCGQPRDRAYNPDSEGHWGTLTHHCEACKAIERRTKLERERDKTAGLRVAVTDVDPHRHLRPWNPRTSLREDV